MIFTRGKLNLPNIDLIDSLLGSLLGCFISKRMLPVRFSIQVDNIKCGGCANSIQTKLLTLDKVSEVIVDIDAGEVTVEVADEAGRKMVVESLLTLGYPETGSAEGLASMGAKAKSFVSCAVGRMNDK